MPGGFLGVDVFFVLSGFLITSLVLDEVRHDGRLRLGAFYVRRARRLAPALFLLLLALAAYAAVAATPGELTRLREHSLWTLGYLANWRFIADGTTYTDLVAGQSPLRHTWSLAIEEQFYLVFPLVVLALGALLRWRHAMLRRALLALGIAGAASSAVWMATLWDGGVDPSRGYFGSDTRAQSLLVGVGLGAYLLGRPPRLGRIVAVVGSAGVVVLTAAVALSHETSSVLQHGGFLLVALAVAGVISATERLDLLRRALSVRPLVALGVVSYGVYLWHWPVVVLVDDDRTGLRGPALGLVQIGLTLGAAALSYLLVEHPIRRGTLGRRLGRPAIGLLPAGATALVLLVMSATVVPPTPAPMSTLAAAPSPTAAPSSRRPLASLHDAPASAPEPVGILMFGDSVAHTLAGGSVGAFPDFEPWAPELSPFDPESARLHSVAKPACSYLPGGIVSGDGPPADLSGFCGDWRGDVDQALRRHPTDVVLVVLANDASHRAGDGRRVELGTAEHARLVAELLDDLRGIARTHGAELAIVALPPRTGSFAQPLDEGGRRERLMREELMDYGRHRPAVRVLDLFEQICPGGDCDHPAGGFDPSWRYDGMHYTWEGARWVADWLARELAPTESSPPAIPAP